MNHNVRTLLSEIMELLLEIPNQLRRLASVALWKKGSAKNTTQLTEK